MGITQNFGHFVLASLEQERGKWFINHLYPPLFEQSEHQLSSYEYFFEYNFKE
jgi:hypothetical protein